MKIAFLDNGVVRALTFTGLPTIEQPYIIINSEIKEPIETWYIEDGEIKIDQQKMLKFNRQNMPNLTKREFRARLRDANIFEQIEAYVKAGDGYLQDAWEYADFFARLDPFIVQAGADLGLLPEVIDYIWIYGKLPEVPEEEPTDVVVNEPESEIQ